jgi:hypothetical protein
MNAERCYRDHRQPRSNIKAALLVNLLPRLTILLKNRAGNTAEEYRITLIQSDVVIRFREQATMVVEVPILVVVEVLMLITTIHVMVAVMTINAAATGMTTIIGIRENDHVIGMMIVDTVTWGGMQTDMEDIGRKEIGIIAAVVTTMIAIQGEEIVTATSSINVGREMGISPAGLMLAT